MTARTPRHHYHSQRSASFGLTITAPTSYLLLCALFQYSEGKSSGAGAYMLNIDTKSGLAWRVTVPARCIAYQLCQLQEVKRQSPNLISRTQGICDREYSSKRSLRPLSRPLAAKSYSVIGYRNSGYCNTPEPSAFVVLATIYSIFFDQMRS